MQIEVLPKFKNNISLLFLIVYKTSFLGYEYSFPFLSDECGIIVDDNYVQPLYKHLINIEHPTMAIVGLPFYVCAFIMFDLQVIFTNKYYKLRLSYKKKFC